MANIHPDKQESTTPTPVVTMLNGTNAVIKIFWEFTRNLLHHHVVQRSRSSATGHSLWINV